MTDGVKRSGGLSIFAAITFAVGTMVGAGVFVLSGMVIDVAGPSAVLSYLICAIVVSFSALSYSALASIFPEDGGGYLYARQMLGAYPGFLAGWAMYISMMIATSFVLLGFGIYLNLLANISIDPRIGAVSALLLLTALNLRGISEAGKFEVGIVSAKIAILALFVMAGLLHVQRTDFTPFLPHGAGGMLSGITMVFFAFMGFQVVSMMAGEIKGSSRSVPRATLISVALVAVIYIGVIIALVSVNLPSYDDKSVFNAAVVLFGAGGGTVIALAAVLSTLSSANANILGASRVVLEMACERQIPGRFARLKKGQPSNAILLGSAITLLLVAYGALDFIVDLTNVAMLITMFLVNISAFRLSKKEAQMPSDKSYFKMPFGGFIPVLGALSVLLMFASIPLSTLAVGIAALFLGSALYVLEDTPEGRVAREKIAHLLGRTSGAPLHEEQ